MKHYIHENGRRCTLGPDNIWRHWDHEPPEPGPREVRDYKCDMDHWVYLMKDGPLPEPDVVVPEQDRGEFGMPGVGHQFAPLLTGQLHAGELTITPGGTFNGSQYVICFPREQVVTELARRIVERHMPSAMDLFLRRNAEYGDDDQFNLGSQGQYVDISRKVQKLKRRMWDRRPARDGEESTETIVMELIGHLLMTMDYMEQEGDAKSDGQTES